MTRIPIATQIAYMELMAEKTGQKLAGMDIADTKAQDIQTQLTIQRAVMHTLYAARRFEQFLGS